MIRERHALTSTVPTLADVHKDPAILSRVSLAVIVDLRRQVSHLAADVDAALISAIAETRQLEPKTEVTPDRLLTPAAAAERFGVTKRWLLKHASDIPGVRRLSRKVIRFSERRLARYLDRTPV
jgi:hypothetical protein